MTEKPRCLVIKQAEERVSKIKAKDLPTDFDPGDMSYNEILANIRHEFTNYEDLLHGLPLCVDFLDQGGECVWDPETGLDCPLSQEAHDLLKWAAKGKAEEVYQRWVEKKP